MTLLRVMLRRSPGRRFVFVGASGCGGHEVARFAHRHRARPALISKPHPEATPLDQGFPQPKRTGRVEWPVKVGVTFANALIGVRR